MVRTIESVRWVLPELDLITNKKALRYIQGTQMSNEDIIFKVRQAARYLDENPNYYKEGQPGFDDFNAKWMPELVAIFDQAGFIRHDIDARGYAIIGLYGVLEEWRYYCSDSWRCKRPRWYYGKYYECYRGVTDEQFSTIMSTIKKNLIFSRNKTNLISTMFGLESGVVPKTIFDIDLFLEHPLEWGRIRRLEADAVETLGRLAPTEYGLLRIPIFDLKITAK